MMKQLLLTFVLSTGFAAGLAMPAFGQDNPNTTQTDQSEEDWRKSKKKTISDDPWNGFKNTNAWGQGTQRSMSPVDRLPEDSRRFLMKQRAQRVAEAGIGEPIDTSFEPSEAAKTDPSLQSDEKDAWSEMMKDMGGTGADPAQGGDASQIPTQVGELGQKDVGQAGSGTQSGTAGSGQTPSSVMRGGSNASVSDILAQIKGGGQAPTAQGQSQQGQAQQGQAQQGQAQQSQGQSQSQNAQSQTGQAPTAQQMNAQGQQGQTQDQAQQAQAQSQAAAQNAAQSASAQANADAAKAAQTTTRTPEAISPLDRLKQTQDERAATGSRSSASDFLKRGN